MKTDRRYSPKFNSERDIPCRHTNSFDQPHPYHAGFSNVGFLYDEHGDRTLIWSSFDPAYTKLVGETHPWALSPAQQKALEEALKPAPDGGFWRFEHPARCTRCHHPIKGPITSDIYYLKYPGSIDLDRGLRLHEALVLNGRGHR